jgi:hypothetical protein
MIGTKKRIYYKIYDQHGVDLNYHWEDAVFESFKKSINGGYGECVINLPRKFDDFGENEDVRLNNRVNIYVVDGDLASGSEGQIIYSGFISRYIPFIQGGKQGVTVILLGHHTKLSQDIYKNGTTTTISEATADIGTIMRNIMARYVAENSGQAILVENSNIDLASVNASYDFKAITYLEAIDLTQRLAPAGWYWYIDNSNYFHFKAKPAGITHYFYYGKSFEEINSNKNMENVINEVLLYNGAITPSDIYKQYKRPSSQGKFGRRVYKLTDRNFADESTMDNYAASILDNYENPDIELTLTLIDNNENSLGYDIESIEVGDTVKIEGFNQTIFEEQMIITEYEYYIDKMVITIKPMKTDVFNKVYGIDKDLEIERAASIPTDYSV